MRSTVPCLFAMGLAHAGCAVTDTTAFVPETDPTAPGLDAGFDPSAPSPAADAGRSKPPGSSGGSSSGGAPTDAGSDTGAQQVAPPPKPAQGEVLISEVMYNPFTPEPTSEWIELYNATNEARSLGGLVLSDNASRTHTIAAGFQIAAHAYVVLARDTNAVVAAKVSQGAIAYEYGTGLPDNAGIQLTNGTTGAIYLRDGGTVIAQSVYGAWFSQSGGSSVQLKTLSYAASQSASGWCLSTKAWTAGSDKGTPGAASDCP